jgi:hypothetical protein
MEGYANSRIFGERMFVPKRRLQRLFFTTTFRLTAEQSSWLTTAAIKILTQQQKHIDRSAILRGLIDGLASARFDISTCSTEKEIKHAVAKSLGADGKTRGVGRSDA